MRLFARHFHLTVIALSLILSGVASAQTYRGGIAGNVQDATGAVVGHAKVMLTGTDTGYQRAMESTGSGAYSFQDLPVGVYSIKVEGSGFQPTTIDKISVQPGQVYALDIKLGVSSTEHVEV
ncbi:MAG TPA: carboxypeptidase-like regulatory domain-containing protein, partial [Acidobacteriaceae bacterium]